MYEPQKMVIAIGFLPSRGHEPVVKLDLIMQGKVPGAVGKVVSLVL